MGNASEQLTGKVYLVGSGPGDPELITVKGLRYLKSADVIIHDRLVSTSLLTHASQDAEVIDVGKKSYDNKGDTQTEINKLLLKKARAGKNVVRLKGGDPFIFGRGAEEAAVLAEANVPFEIVSGITSAVAAASYAGIPLSHRDTASSITFLTGSEAADKKSIDWDSVARLKGTLVILMGWKNLPEITTNLINEGYPSETPVALIQWGTKPYQRTVTGVLANIVSEANRMNLGPPVVAVIGEVVNLRRKLQWFDNRPLFGVRVLITRSRTRAGILSSMLAQEGAHPIEVPTIEIQPIDDYTELDFVLKNLSKYDWVVFPSTNAIEVVIDRLATLNRDARAFSSTRIAAIGSASNDTLKARGIIADFIPEKYVSESVAEGLKQRIKIGQRVFLPQADIGRNVLSDSLTKHGVNVHKVTIYRTVTPKDSYSTLTHHFENGVDVITFTSSSTINNLVTLLKGDLSLLQGIKIACIGPITAQAAIKAGLNVDILATEYTIDGLVKAVKNHYNKEIRSNE